MRSFSLWWSGFSYNYCWSDWVGYVDGWIPKFSLFFPLIGYMILFNDEMTSIIEFRHITQQTTLFLDLSATTRLRLLYYGLFFLGVSNFIYKIKRPYIFRFGTNFIEYTKTALENFTFGDFLNIHGSIRHEGHRSTDGKYYDSEWEGFVSAATNEGEGTDNVKRTGSWENAKSQYGSLLRSMLRENFIKRDVEKRFWLTFCVIFSTLGYILLAIPSVDLFAKVTVSALSL